MTMGKVEPSNEPKCLALAQVACGQSGTHKKLLCAYVNRAECLEPWIIFSNWNIFLQVNNKALVLSFMIALQYIYFCFNGDVFAYICTKSI